MYWFPTLSMSVFLRTNRENQKRCDGWLCLTLSVDYMLTSSGLLVCVSHMYRFPTLAVSALFSDEQGEPEALRREDVLDPFCR